MNVSLIIPAHNEHARLRLTPDPYAAALHARCGDSFDIPIVAETLRHETLTRLAAQAAPCPEPPA